MNGYNLSRNWYNFKFDNPTKTNARHSDMYFYIVDLWNRLGQKSEFGLPTMVTMELLQIGSYNTYKKTLNDLIDFGFIKIIKESKNQHQSKIIALSKYDKATDKALDKAHNKATDKATDTIIEQRTINKETIEQIYNTYPTKCPIRGASTNKSKHDKIKIGKVLKDTDTKDLIFTINKYVEECKSTNTYMMHFKTFLNNIPDYTIPVKEKTYHWQIGFTTFKGNKAKYDKDMIHKSHAIKLLKID